MQFEIAKRLLRREVPTRDPAGHLGRQEPIVGCLTAGVLATVIRMPMETVSSSPATRYPVTVAFLKPASGFCLSDSRVHTGGDCIPAA